MSAAAAPAHAAPAGAPGRPRHPGWLIAVGAGVVAGLVGSVLLYRHAVRIDRQPSPAAGAPDVAVPHYATPWVLAAAAAALAGLLLAVTLVTALVRRRTDAVLVPDGSVLPAAPHPFPAPDGPELPSPTAAGTHPDDVWRPPVQATG